MFLALLKLDERTRKGLLILAALFIIALLILGLIYLLISLFMRKSAKKIDPYMYDLCKYKIVKNPRQFKEAVKYYEYRLIHRAVRFTLLALIILTAGLIIFAAVKPEVITISQLFTEAKHALPHIKWTTLADVNAILEGTGADPIYGISWLPVSFLPTITWDFAKEEVWAAVNKTAFWISLSYYVVAICLWVQISGCALSLTARLHRGRVKSEAVFSKSLETASFGD